MSNKKILIQKQRLKNDTKIKRKYKNEIIKNLMAKLSLNNIHAVPRIDKIVLNMGLGAEALEKKKLETCIKDIAAIAGQQPVVTKILKNLFQILNQEKVQMLVLKLH